MLVSGGKRRRSGRVHCFQSDKCQHRLLLCQFAMFSSRGTARKNIMYVRWRDSERRDTRKERDDDDDAQIGAAA